ncbi:hypothetical protein BCR26_10650 [Enterococcus rivorum]|uniref:Calcineurin-like phosphoesterase domain-containing protein n=1 Tax=Enterococcus rivorum TaxID=762845 RepID=A0A1E5KZL1_9ENTE|nr:hypothetical protein BCR26_10650 [Enterococcus rivorum]
MNKIAVLIISLLLFLSSYYVGSKILTLLEKFLKFKWPVLFWMIFSLLTLSTCLTFLLFDKNVGAFVGKLGSYWFAFLLTALVVFGLTGVFYRIASKLMPLSDQNETLITLGALLFILLFIGYGFWQGQAIKTAHYQVNIDKRAKSDKKNLRAVLISDVHLGYINDEKKFEKIVTKINALHPDIVLISGDLFDGNYEALQEPQKIIKELNRLNANYGTYLCWGNHDAGETFKKMKALVAKTDITLLEDEIAIVEDTFLIAGRKDSRPIGSQDGKRQSIEKQLKAAREDLPVIILDHQPSTINEYGGNVDLIVSGHTHQGQVFPFNLVTNAYFTVDYGYYRKENVAPQVVVSSGVGVWGPPMRVGTQSEIVAIDIKLK